MEMDELEIFRVTLWKLMEKLCPPVHLDLLMRAYRMETSEEVPFNQFGYSNAQDFLKENFPELNLVQSGQKYVVHLRDATSSAGETPPRAALECSENLPTQSTTTRTIFVPKQWVKKKIVPVQFKRFLAKLLDQYPLGISAKDFVDVFYKESGSALSYKLYGYPGHLSMFKDLPDVFRVEQVSEYEHMLFPLEKSYSETVFSNELKNRSAYEASRDCSGGEDENRILNHTSRPMTLRVRPDRDPVKLWTTPQGTLFTVNLDGDLLVPTGCLAFMAGLDEDDVLLRLKQEGIDIVGVKFLTNEFPEHIPLLEKLAAFKCPLLISTDGRPPDVVPLVPFGSCCFILSAFSGRTSKIRGLLGELRSTLTPLEFS